MANLSYFCCKSDCERSVLMESVSDILSNVIEQTVMLKIVRQTFASSFLYRRNGFERFVRWKNNKVAYKIVERLYGSAKYEIETRLHRKTDTSIQYEHNIRQPDEINTVLSVMIGFFYHLYNIKLVI